jgi:hypothetical protein
MLGDPYYDFVDSDNADSGHTGDFTYTINLPQNHNYDSVTLRAGSFPKSYYTVREGLNHFTLTELNGTVTITIPAANYSMLSFKEVLQTELNAQSPGGYTYSINMELSNNTGDTGKYTYTVSGNNGDQPIFNFPIISLLYKQMGFNHNSTNTFVANTLVSPNICNFVGVSGLYLISDCVNGANVGAGIGSNILELILPNNTQPLSNINFLNPDPINSAKKLKSGFGPIFNFKICDLDDKIINFNGVSCNFTLCFFKRDNLSELLINYLKAKQFEEEKQKIIKRIEDMQKDLNNV